MKFHLLLLICICLIPTSATGADSYLCVPYMSTGFSFNRITKNWNYSEFKTQNKYIVKKIEKGDPLGALGYKWQIVTMGDATPLIISTNDLDEEGRLIFDYKFKHFNMNTKNMKFIYSYMYGYWTEGSTRDDTPFLEIGKCSEE